MSAPCLPAQPLPHWREVALEVPHGPGLSDVGSGFFAPGSAACALLALLRDAGAFAITALDLAHPYAEEIDTFLMAAAEQHWLDRDIPLSRVLWTRPAALWNGQVAAGLAELARVSAKALPGFLCIHAQDAGPRGLSWLGAPPMPTACRIAGDFTTGGPYRVLLRCESDWTGAVTLTGGFAQAVHSFTLPLPVAHPLERDVLVLLLKVQQLADAAGQAVTIARSFCGDVLSPLQIVLPGERTVGAISCGEPAHRSVASVRCTPCSAARHVTAQSLADGTFQAWLAGLDWSSRSTS